MISPQEPQRTAAEVRRSWWPGWIWAVPIAALIVVGWLGLRALTQGGKTVTVTFDQAAGVRKTDTKVVYRGVEIGEVTGVDLAPGGRSVVVKLNIQKQGERFLRTGTRFWLIGAHPSLSRLSELKDALTGPQIGLQPSVGAPAKAFRGLDEPPEDAPVGPQIGYFVRFDGAVGDLKPGAPVRLDGFRVGRVTSAALRYDAKAGTVAAVAGLTLEPQRLGLETPNGRADADAMMDRLIRQGLRAQLVQSPPLVGPRQIELAFAAEAERSGLQTLGDQRFIPAASGPDLKALEAKAGSILDKIDAAPITQIGENVRAATRRLRQIVQSPDIDRILNQVDDATARLDQAIQQASPQIGPLITQLRRTADDADRTVAAARKVVAGDATSQDSDLPSALHEITGAARALRVLADELQRRPESLIRGKPKEER